MKKNAVFLIVFLVCTVLVVMVLIIQSRERVREAQSKMKQLQCAGNLYVIYNAFEQYTNQNHGIYPYEISDITQYLSSSRSLICPFAEKEPRTIENCTNYVWIKNSSSNLFGFDALVYCNAIHTHQTGKNVLRFDGVVTQVLFCTPKERNGH